MGTLWQRFLIEINISESPANMFLKFNCLRIKNKPLVSRNHSVDVPFSKSDLMKNVNKNKKRFLNLIEENYESSAH